MTKIARCVLALTVVVFLQDSVQTGAVLPETHNAFPSQLMFIFVRQEDDSQEAVDPGPETGVDHCMLSRA